jgi:hypothetical protein
VDGRGDEDALADLPVLERVGRARLGDLDRPAGVLRRHSAETIIHVAGLGGAGAVVVGGVAVWVVVWLRRRRAEALVDAEIERELELEAERQA